MHFLKKILIIAIIAGALYMLTGYHYIIIENKSVKMLKKSSLTLKYTFISTKSRDIDAILSKRELWDDGIGNLLYDEGVITKEELENYRNKMHEE